MKTEANAPLIGSMYKRVYSSEAQTLFKVRDLIYFVGEQWAIVERVRPARRCDIATVRPEFFTSEVLQPATDDEWLSALASARVHMKEEQERELRLANGKKYGIPVDLTNGGLAYIVRSTRASLFDHNDARYSRRTGIGAGGSRFYRTSIEHADLAKVEEYLAGREKVDVVKERMRSTAV